MKHLALMLAAAAMLAGCGAATAEKHAASPSATVNAARQACHMLSLVPDDDVNAKFDPRTWQAAAQTAKKAADPGVSAAGGRLLKVVATNEQLSEADRQGRPNIDLSEATLKLAQACAGLYGDGPW